jgi:DNA-binding transcriptional ArsR family regulator/uncharacterized protein YndB with AHSA1/START domain
VADQLSRLFAALADPTRRDIVARLAVGDATVGQLAEPYEVSVQAVSKHLKVLEEAGLVRRSRDAQRRPVHLEPEVLELMTSWIERYRRAAEERFRRLDAVLAEMNDPARTPTPPRSRHHEHRDRGPHRGRPDRPVIRITRDFAGTPEQLFRAHTDPEIFVRWVGPDSTSSRIDHWDARTGGSFRYVATHGDDEYGFRGCFHEVRPDRIVQTFTWEGMPDGWRWRPSSSRTWATGAPGCTRRRCATASTRATAGCRAAWRSGSTRATRSSTACCCD